MNIYCGIQLKFLFSLAFRLQNLKLTRIFYIEQCLGEGRDHCLLLNPERISLLFYFLMVNYFTCILFYFYFIFIMATLVNEIQ